MQQQARLHAATWTRTQGSQGHPDSLAAPTPLTKPRNELEQLPSSASPPTARQVAAAPRGCAVHGSTSQTRNHTCPHFLAAGEGAGLVSATVPCRHEHIGCQGRADTSPAGRRPAHRHGRRHARITASASVTRRAPHPASRHALPPALPQATPPLAQLAARAREKGGSGGGVGHTIIGFSNLHMICYHGLSHQTTTLS